MATMTLDAKALADAVGGVLVRDSDAALTLLDATTDSREAKAGGVFFARIGEQNDGLDYLPKAAGAGAGAVVTQNAQKALDLDPKIAVIEVDDVTYAYGQAAAFHLRNLREAGPVTVIGITGSAGKTTTKDLLAGICRAAGPTTAPVGSFNNEVGLPRTVLSAPEGTRYLVLEMGASGVGHIEYLTSIAPLDVAIELLVGRAHLGGFGSQEAVAQAKAELLGGLVPGGVAVLNIDDSRVAEMTKYLSEDKKLLTFAAGQQADFYASGVEVDSNDRTSFTVHHDGTHSELSLGLVGAHHVSNALAAIAGAVAAGIPLELAVAKCAGTKATSPHRMDVRHLESGAIVIDDAYNANPDSMKAALGALAIIGKGRRKIAVLGEMLELGPQSDDIHREVGKVVAANGVDVVVVVGQGAKPLLETVSERAETISAADYHEAASLIKDLPASADVILFKGSNGSGVWRLADQLLKEENACSH
ncbi:UDP-N-acetylmuramoyl-tripeptide--D-alanyl-D-alanine ligase [Winkia sp. UMB0889B]|uniref:UDP-N-acetylmuramoyl-tripeptide--D-alanyl-D- alanine ligase n=1 Tax=Winkia sp. UMB0889B TaxID=3046315 RepID=UPI0025535C56|nr:UDP-N-acetylmuramoyl-tripeptide--D-alanyl-D-alanine ligase [Winkia sp. UMB0889B]